MKTILALFFIFAFIGMAMAGVHHYRIDRNGGQDAAPQEIDDSRHGGTIFDAAANGLNSIGGAIGNFFGLN
ncbi:hypothetical protein AVEN_203849-1 [Araneus ventricosus]|uniref:Uncharacterized protein n=1 Tax=Araneus ventricosus TaxID=182803 RepID=A0A4Y2NYK2_ARAVE|nr:hypothetical protein AVEN_203849-1 [Araneus ventricosus]